MKNDTRHSWYSMTNKLSAKYHLDILNTTCKPLIYFMLAPRLDGRLSEYSQRSQGSPAKMTLRKKPDFLHTPESASSTPT